MDKDPEEKSEHKEPRKRKRETESRNSDDTERSKSPKELKIEEPTTASPQPSPGLESFIFCTNLFIFYLSKTFWGFLLLKIELIKNDKYRKSF